MCIFTQKIPKFLLCFFTKHFFHKQPVIYPSNYKTCLYNLFVYLYTKNTKVPPVFFHKNTTFQKKSSCVLTKHLNPSNYKTCLYNLFVYLYTKNTKVPPVFFHKTLHFKKTSSCVLTKHLNPSNYKTCLYNLFVYLYTKNTKVPPVFFHKNTTFQKKSSCVLTKHLNPSNYKTCLYNLFVYLYTKNTKVPPVFFSQNTFFTNNLSYIRVSIKPVYTNYLCIFTQKIPKFLLCFFTKTLHFKKNPHVFSQKHLNPSNYKTCLYNLFVYLYTKNTKVPPVFFHKTLFSQTTCHKSK